MHLYIIRYSPRHLYYPLSISIAVFIIIYSTILHCLELFCITSEFIYHTHVVSLSLIHSTPTHINLIQSLTINYRIHSHSFSLSIYHTHTDIYLPHSYFLCHVVNEWSTHQCLTHNISLPPFDAQYFPFINSLTKLLLDHSILKIDRQTKNKKGKLPDILLQVMLLLLLLSLDFCFSTLHQFPLKEN